MANRSGAKIMVDVGSIERAECLIEIQSRLLNFIRQRTVSLEDAEDLAQETLLAVWLNLDQFRDESNLETWAFAIAKNKIHDMIRNRIGREGNKGGRERRLERYFCLSCRSEQRSTFDLDYLLTRIDTDLILSLLSEGDADLLRKYYIDGNSQKELGLQLGKTQNAVGIKLRQLLKKCRERKRINPEKKGVKKKL